MIKAVLFDIDGTILDHETSKVPQETRQAIRLLKDQDIKVYIASGRHITELQELDMIDIDFDGYVLLNGQLCLDQDKVIFYQEAIEDTDLLIEMFNEKRIPIALVEEDRLYMNTINEYVKKAHQEISTSLPPIASYHGQPIYLVIPYGNDEDIEEVVQTLPHCKAVKWNPYAADIFPKKGSKVSGIKEILKRDHLHREEIMAFGDGDNDIEMLEFAEIGVAMGNSSDEVKKHADYVCKDCHLGGILETVVKLLENNKESFIK